MSQQPVSQQPQPQDDQPAAVQPGPVDAPDSVNDPDEAHGSDVTDDAGAPEPTD